VIEQNSKQTHIPSQNSHIKSHTKNKNPTIQ